MGGTNSKQNQVVQEEKKDSSYWKQLVCSLCGRVDKDQKRPPMPVIKNLPVKEYEQVGKALEAENLKTRVLQKSEFAIQRSTYERVQDCWDGYKEELDGVEAFKGIVKTIDKGLQKKNLKPGSNEFHQKVDVLETTHCFCVFINVDEKEDDTVTFWYMHVEAEKGFGFHEMAAYCIKSQSIAYDTNQDDFRFRICQSEWDEGAGNGVHVSEVDSDTELPPVPNAPPLLTPPADASANAGTSRKDETKR